MPAGRALQPGTLVPDGPRLWVLDQLQPAAVVLDALNGDVVDRVGFGHLLAPSDNPDFPAGWWGQTTGDGLLVQAPHRDGVVLLEPGAGASPTDHRALADPFPRIRPLRVDGPVPSVSWLHGPHTWAGGRRWKVGCSVADRVQPRAVYAVGETTDDDAWRVEVGRGTALTAITHVDGVWVSVESQRLVASYSRPVPVSLVRLNASSGEVRIVLGAAAVDISDLCWPLSQGPADPRAFEESWRDKIHLEAPRWSVTVSGRWPFTDLVVVLDHPRVPDVQLRRRMPLYDELGRRTPPQYTVVHVGEQFATVGPPQVTGEHQVVDF